MVKLNKIIQMPDSVLANPYDPAPFYDEMFSSVGEARQHYDFLREHLQNMTAEMIADRRRVADAARMGRYLLIDFVAPKRGSDLPMLNIRFKYNETYKK